MTEASLQKILDKVISAPENSQRSNVPWLLAVAAIALAILLLSPNLSTNNGNGISIGNTTITNIYSVDKKVDDIKKLRNSYIN